MKKLRVGVIGRGFGAKVIVPAFKRVPSCEIAAVAGVADWKSLVKDTSIDAICIAVPPSAQARIVSACATAQKHIFMEKPLCAHWSEVEGIRRTFRRHQGTVVVDFEFPELKRWKKMRELIRAGQAGPVRHASIDWHLETYANKHRTNDNWKTRSTEGAGALTMFGSHALYHLEWFFGRAVKVSAHIFRFSGAPGNSDTAISATFQMKSGHPVFINISTHTLETCHRILVQGDQGALRLENNTSDHVRGFELSVLSRKTPSWKKINVPEIPLHPKDGRISAVNKMAERFVSAALKRRQTAPALSEAIRVQYLMECIRRSSKSGRWISCA